MAKEFAIPGDSAQIVDVQKAIRQVIRTMDRYSLRNDKVVYSCLKDLVPECPFLGLIGIALENGMFSEEAFRQRRLFPDKYIEEQSAKTGLSKNAVQFAIDLFMDSAAEQPSATQISNTSASDVSQEAVNQAASELETGANPEKNLRILNAAAEKDNLQALWTLANVYLSGKYVSKEVSKAVELLEKAARAGSENACIQLFEMYYNGNEVEVDYDEALYWLDSIPEIEVKPEWNIYKSKAHLELGEKDEAYQAAKKAVQLCPESGEADLQLGLFYELGAGTAQNYREAARLYNSAIQKGNYSACLYLGGFYQQGVGVEQNQERALSLYLRGAQYNDAMCLNAAGYAYEYGIGTVINHKKAVEFYRKGANAGNFASAQNLGRCFLEGIGVEENLQKSIYWLDKAVDLGSAVAAKWLSSIYLNPAYGVQNGNKAAEYLDKLLDMNPDDPDALYMYGQLSLEGIGGYPVNGVMGIIYYKQAAKLGNPEAMNNLGLQYYSGRYVNYNPELACEYFRDAAELGYGMGRTNLAYFCLRGLGTKQDVQRAVQLLEKPAEEGIVEAQEYLGQIYFEGWSGVGDFKKAAMYLGAAAQGGSEYAQKCLAENFKRSGSGWKIAKGLFSKVRDGEPLPEPYSPAHTGKCRDCPFRDGDPNETVVFCRKINNRVFTKTVCEFAED